MMDLVRPMVVPQAFPCRQDSLRGRGGERPQGGEQPHPAPKVRNDGGRPSLLEHDLGYPHDIAGDPPGTSGAPGEWARVALVPPQETCTGRSAHGRILQ